jgi:hypothetical protein
VNIGYRLDTSLGTGQNWDESMKYFKAVVRLGISIMVRVVTGVKVSALTVLKHLNTSKSR